MFDKLSNEQKSTITGIAKMKVEVGLVGLDANDNPVLWVKDQRRTVMMAVRPEGAGDDKPVEPLRWFTDEEVEGMEVSDSALLFSLPIKEPITEDTTQEVSQDATG